MQFNNPPRKIKIMTTLHFKKSISRSTLRRGFVLAALALACFALPIEARADCGITGDIPFTVTLLNPIKTRYTMSKCFFVKGPWARVSIPGVTLGDLPVGQPCTFYAANDNVTLALRPLGAYRLSYLSSLGCYPRSCKISLSFAKQARQSSQYHSRRDSQWQRGRKGFYWRGESGSLRCDSIRGSEHARTVPGARPMRGVGKGLAWRFSRSFRQTRQ